MENTSKNLHYLDSLRGIAAIIVVISHSFLWFVPSIHDGSAHQGTIEKLIFDSPFSFFYRGSSSVYLFFILSGYVLAYSCFKKNNDTYYIIKSIHKRYFRLGIPVAASILISYILMSLGFFKADDFNIGNISPIAHAYTSQIGFLPFLKSFFYESMLFGDRKFNYVLWSISVEFFGSLLVYFIMISFGNDLVKLRVVTFLFSFFTLLTQQNVMFIYYGLFTLGIFMSTFPIKTESSFSRGVISILIIILGLYFFGYCWNSTSYIKFAGFLTHIQELFNLSIFWPVFIPAIGAALILSTIMINSNVLYVLNKKPLVFLGKISFSIYLLHTLVLAVIAPFVYKLDCTNFTKSLITLVFTLLVTIIVSIPFYNYIDKRTIALLR
ncbi:TPA: acyltransferase family protein [Photobacterium damselae]